MNRKKISVLLVEDDQNHAALISRAFEPLAARINLIVARNLDKARACISISLPDLVIADLILPDGKGTELLPADKYTSSFPVVVMTSQGDEQAAVDAIKAGALDYVVKSKDAFADMPHLAERVLREWSYINERKKAAAALKESEAKYHLLVDNANEAIIVAQDGMFKFCNPKTTAITGYSLKELYSIPFAEIIHPDDREMVVERHHKRLKGEDVPHVYKFRMISKEGKVVWVEINAVLITWESEPATLNFISDITERRQAEEALRDSEEQYRALFETMAQGVVYQNTRGEIISANPAAEKIFGLSLDQMKGRTSVDPRWKAIHEDGSVLPGETHPSMVALKTGEEVNNVVMGVFHPLRKEYRWININAVPQFKPGEKKPYRVYTTFTDITDLRKSEERLRQAQKMEAIGRLAGGIAHDFNNLLTTIIGYSDLMLIDNAVSESGKEYINEVKRAADRATSLTQQLLAFSRKQILQPKVINLNTLIVNLNKMLIRLIVEDIELMTELESGLKPVKVDPGQMEQAIMNLVINARDSMPKGGKLIIETQNVNLDEGYRQEHPEVTPGGYALLTVSDTGYGMDEETRSHAFDPFFTTKEVGKGTGLGLSTVYGIVKQSGGYIWMYSEPNQGTTVKIYLPQIGEDMDQYNKSISAKYENLGGTETILLVEDETALRKMAQKSLEGKGYKVIEAGSGTEALAAAEGPRLLSIDLLITDVVMPGMSGTDLAEQLHEKFSGLKVLYISGYTDDVVARHGVSEEGVSFLQKPFTPASLAQTVREVLDEE